MEGWSSGKMRSLLKVLAYRIERINKNSWHGTYNGKCLPVKQLAYAKK